MVSNVHPPFMRVCVRASVYVCVYAHLIFCVIPFLLGAQSFVHGDSGLQTGVPACHSGFRTTFKSTPSQMNPPKNEISTVIIKYVHGRVTVDVNLHSSDTWTRCIDVENVVLNDDGYYFGVTASTGTKYLSKHPIGKKGTLCPYVSQPVAKRKKGITKEEA